VALPPPPKQPARLEDVRNFRQVDARLTTCGQPSEAQLAAARDAGVEVVINLALHGRHAVLVRVCWLMSGRVPAVVRHATLVAAVLLIAYGVPALARIGVDGPNGFMINMNASFAPDGEALPSGIIEGAGRIHRFVLDRGQQRYFAYDLVMTASGTDVPRETIR